MTWEQFQQYLVIGIQDGSIYALIGLGFTIIYAVTNIINFAQGEFVMLGGMATYMLVESADVPFWPSLTVSILCAVTIGAFIQLLLSQRGKFVLKLLMVILPLALIPAVLFSFREFGSIELHVGIASFLAVLMVTVVGAIMYLLGIRTARKPSIVGLIIITIGAALVIRGLAGALFGEKGHRMPLYWDHSPVEIGSANVHTQVFWIFAAMIIVAIVLRLFFTHTMLGKSLTACAHNPTGAGLMGVNPRMMALIAFSIAALVGGIIGAVMSPRVQIDYESGFLFGLYGFVAASLGGFRSQTGAVIGGFLVGVGRAMIIGINWGPFTADYKDVWPMVLLIAILLLRSGRLAEEERLG